MSVAIPLPVSPSEKMTGRIPSVAEKNVGETDEIIRHYGSSDPSRGRIQKMDPGFPPSEWKVTGWGSIRRSRKRTGHVPPGLPAIAGTEHRNCFCCSSSRPPTSEYPAMLSVDEGHLL